MSERERVKRRLNRRLTRMLAECEQTIRDADWWADNRTEHAPLDVEWFIVQAAGIRKSLAALERNEWMDPAWIQTC